MATSKSKYASNLWKLKLIRFLFWMHFFASVLIPFFTEWGNLKLSQVLFLNSWFMLWNFLLEVPTGTVADFLGRKTSLVVGSLFAVGAANLYVMAPRYEIFLIAEIVFAVAYTLHSGADEALAYDSLKEMGKEKTSKRELGSMESFKLAGIVFATLTGGFLAAKFGLTTPMRAYSIPALLACLVALTLKEPPVHDSETSPTTRGYLQILRSGGRYFAKHPVLLLLTTELALSNALAWGIIWLFQPLLIKAGYPVQAFGIVHALSCIGQIAFLSQVERIEGWLGSKRKLLFLTSLFTATAFATLAVVQTPLVVALAIILGFTFSLPRIPIFSSYINKHIPSSERATVLSLSSMCRTFAIVIINPIIGILSDYSVTRTMAILSAGILLFAVLSRIEEEHLID